MDVDERLEWEQGDALVISRRSCKPGEGLSYERQTVIAVEPGFAGGWDVWEGHNGAGVEMSFYGFSVSAVIKR